MYKRLIYVLIFVLNLTLNFSFAQIKSGKIIYKLSSSDMGLRNAGGILYFDNDHSLYVMNNSRKEQTAIYKANDGSIIYPSNTIDSIANKTRFIYYNKLNGVFYNNIINNDTETIIKDGAKMSWTVSTKTKKNLGYKCYKAVGELYGNEYEVWFTRQLKFPYGPIKINGLSGIILELNSPAAGLKIKAEKITVEGKGITSFIRNFNKKYDYSSAVTREEYRRLLQNKMKKLEDHINAGNSYWLEKTKFKDLDCRDCNNQKK